MSISGTSNVGSSAAMSNVDSAQRALNASMARLSTGLRINRAADTSVGLGVSERFAVGVQGTARAGYVSSIQDTVELGSADRSRVFSSSGVDRYRALASLGSGDAATKPGDVDAAARSRALNALGMSGTAAATGAAATSK